MSEGRRVVITGANRGLGLELARQCAARGDRVFAACRRPGEADDLQDVAEIVPMALDVADAAAVAAFGAALRAATDRVDLLFNNAGVNGTAFGAPDGGRGVLQIDPANFMAQMRVNALGPMLVARAVLPLLRAAGTSKIVNMTSQLGSMALGTRMLRDVGYNASKAALNMITTALAGALRDDGVVVTAIHPGWVRTDMGGERAPLGAEEAARSILETVDGLEARDSGLFLRWDGSLHPW